MQYGLDATIQHLRSEVSECSAEIQELSAKVVEQAQELNAMKSQVEKAREELSYTRHALKDTVTKLQLVQKQRDCARNRTLKSHEMLEATIADFVHFEEELLVNSLIWLVLFRRKLLCFLLILLCPYLVVLIRVMIQLLFAFRQRRVVKFIHMQ